MTVIITNFAGSNEQIRIIGEAAKPQAIPYRQNMTVLDVIILAGGLTEFADGNKSGIGARRGERQTVQRTSGGSRASWRHFGQRRSAAGRVLDHSAELVLITGLLICVRATLQALGSIDG